MAVYKVIFRASEMPICDLFHGFNKNATLKGTQRVDDIQVCMILIKLVRKLVFRNTYSGFCCYFYNAILRLSNV